MSDREQQLVITGPTKGLMDGRDPGLGNELYSPLNSPNLRNVRVQDGLWACRCGMRSWRTAILGSGRTRYLTTVYMPDGSRYRLAARGADGSVQLYKWLDGTDPSSPGWVAVGSANLAGNFFQGVDVTTYTPSTLKAKQVHYFTDRDGVLQKYDPAAGTRSDVAAITGPAAAPAVVPSYWGILETWPGSPSFGWTETNDAKFHIENSSIEVDDGSDVGQTVRLVAEVDAKGEKIRENVYGEQAQSNTIAFWFEQSTSDSIFAFDVGLTKQADFPNNINPPKQKRNYLFFVPIGGIGTINNKQFRARKNPQDEAAKLWVSPLYLPGRLQGTYRYRYSYYNSTTFIDSTMSPATDPQDFSALPISYAEGSSAALRKVAILKPVASGSTLKIKVYRTGGVLPLTTDPSGQEVWVEIGEILDFATTLSGAVTAADTSLPLTALGNAAGNVTDGDWLVLESGTPNLEEYVRIQNYQYTDLATSGDDTHVTSALRPFVAADVGRTLTVKSGTNWTAGVYTISAVALGVATITDVGTHAATAGKATLSASNGTGNVLLAFPVAYAHSSGKAVQVVYGDNLSNEGAAALLATKRTYVERDGPPRGIHWISVSPEGRLYAARYKEDRDSDGTYENRLLSVAVSNKPTPVRPNDHEVFPFGVSPETRRSPIQGWRFDIPAESGDEIVWAGFYKEVFSVVTRLAVYQVHARSQAQWGPSAVVKRLYRGSISGEATKELNGLLMWPSDGPSILSWDGHGPVEDKSYLRIFKTLNDAPAGTPPNTNASTPTAGDASLYWRRWFAEGHSENGGLQYSVCVIPSEAVLDDLQIDPTTNTVVTSQSRLFVASDVGKVLSVVSGTGFNRQNATINSVSAGAATLSASAGTLSSTGGTAKLHRAFPHLWLDYDLVSDAWTAREYFKDTDSDGFADTPIQWECSAVNNGPGDDRAMIGAAYDTASNAGALYEMETGKTDNGIPIKFEAETKRFALGAISEFQRMFLRLDRKSGSCDTLRVIVTMGGAEYGEVSECFTVHLAGVEDTEVPLRCDPGKLRGRWISVRLEADASSLPALRELDVRYVPIREERAVP